jgi:Lamin Tail Domain
MTKLVAVACLLVGCASAEEALPGGGFDFAAAAGDDFAVAPGDLARRTNGDGGVIGNCPPTQHIVVNELKTGGTAAGASDEFVELYNPCDVDVDLTGWSLVYRSATGTTDVTIVNLARTIASGGFLLVAGPTYSNGGTPDQTYGTGRLAQAGGGVGLRDPTDGAGRLRRLRHGDQHVRRGRGGGGAGQRSVAGAHSQRRRQQPQRPRLHGRHDADAARNELTGSRST